MPFFKCFKFNTKVKSYKLKNRLFKKAKATNLILMTLLKTLQALILYPLFSL